MTDKQIIIDGVNVAKCRCFTSEWDFNNCGHICKGTECKYKRLWYKKQLKRKEQECEELKKIIQRHDNDNNALLKEVEDKLCEYYRRYRECLTEIKEIAESMNNECFYSDFDCKDCDMKNGCTYFNKKQILQKISECKGEYNEKIR